MYDRGDMLRYVWSWLVAVALIMGMFSNIESISGESNPSEGVFLSQSLDRLRYLVLKDAASGLEENYGSTPAPEYEPLEIHKSDDPQFEYMASTPYYTVYLKGTVVRMKVKDAWVEFEMENQEWGEAKRDSHTFEENEFLLHDVYESVDLSYEVESSLLTEMLVLQKSKQFSRLIQKISWEGMSPAYEEDGSIIFSSGDSKIIRILPPFLRDARGDTCADMHYELIETEKGCELHKVLDERGSDWLKNAVFPVVVDPSVQTLEDAWKDSGLQPYGQYFTNLRECVNPVNGHLTITQTDLVIPGRKLDIVVSRVYETPAVFHWENPYEMESPPVDVGKGWQLDFPYIGAEYVHLWGGVMYLLQWNGNQFENHIGHNFVLVKNGDNTYTMTMADGAVYSFAASGKLTQIRDIDLNTVTFIYTNGLLTSITDTIGRVVTLSYANNRLWKITYDNCEVEYSYDGNGCLVWMDDFMNRRTRYYYNSGFNTWLLSKIEYPTAGYTTYVYNRFIDSGGYYKYYVTDQRVYETDQVRHSVFSYTGSFIEVTASVVTVKNESEVTQGSYSFTIDDDVITQSVVKNAQGATLRKMIYAHSSRKEILQESMYNDGTTLSYTNYYAYDNWGNVIYVKNPSGHEQFSSYANTSTSGFFVDNTNTVTRQFTNAFFNSSVPSSVHTALLGVAERQDQTFVREMYLSYDAEAHPLQSKSLFGNTTTYLTFSGTFNEKTGSASFPIDLTGHAVAGNAVLQITGLPSDDTYQEIRTFNCPCYTCSVVSGAWSGSYFTLTYKCVDSEGSYTTNITSIGPFAYYPGAPGYESYATSHRIGQGFVTFSVITTFKAYPAQVQYNLDSSSWKTITTKLQDGTAGIAVPISNGSHTLYFSESSSYQTKFSWSLYVPVDNTPPGNVTTTAYDYYGNVTSITDAEFDTVTFSYSPAYAYAYLTEISATVGSDTITTKATYDYYRGWVTSIQQPKGVVSSGYDTLYTHDLLGRMTKKEFPLLPGQSQRTSVEAIYDDADRTITMIDQLRHYVVRQYDRLGRLVTLRQYMGTYGSGTLYATTSYTYEYGNRVSTVTDPSNHTYAITSDFLGRYTQLQYPNSSSVSCSYDDTSNKVTVTTERGYRKVFWYDWLFQLTKVEEEYQTSLFAVTTYQYDEIGHLTCLTDAEGRTTDFMYASLFGLTKRTYPDSTYEEYTYDSAGKISSFIDGKGNEITYSYDSLNRLTQMQYKGQSVISFSYDLNSNLIGMSDNAPQAGDYAEYSFDSWNRMVSETRHISQNIYTVSFQYDEASRLTKLTYPDEMEILYSYDDLNRATEIKRYVDGLDDEILMSNLQYTSESLITQFDYGNGLRALFSYDSEERPLTICVRDGETPYLNLSLTWDSSNLTQMVNEWRDTSLNWHSDTESYSYDGLDRLTSATCASWSHTYTYDRVGNRTARDSVMYTVNSVNEITALSDGTSFMYDDNGNRTQKTKGMDTWVYTYDFANRLTMVEKNSIILGEYKYDGGGRRIQKTEDNVTTTYIYSGLGVLYEENATGAATYIYGPTGRLAKRTTIAGESNTFFYHTDHLGSTRLVTDENKSIVSAAAYDPFGESQSEEGTENYLFAGKEKDSTGLYYFGARYYDCETGTFITRDLLAGTSLNSQSLNQYSYCQNNPLKYVDLWGLEGKRPSWQDVDQPTPSEREKKGGTGFPFGSLTGSAKIGQDLYWNKGYVFMIYGTFFMQGNVGVAIGVYATPNLSPQSQRVFDTQFYGLLIFVFDSEGNVVEWFFIPFDDLNDPEKKQEWLDILNREFEEHGVDWTDFNAVLQMLEDHCQEMADKLNTISTFGIGIAGAGVLEIISALALSTVIFGLVTFGAGAYLAIALYVQARMYASWLDAIDDFQNAIFKYRESSRR